jgi:hypothetical protein
MENLWKLIEAAIETDLHDLAVKASDEWGEIKEKLENLEKEIGGESYQPQEYPKMVGDKVVHNVDEEAALTTQS